MLTKTIGQLSAASSVTDADLLEIEQSGASKYGTVAQLVAGVVATTAESLLATSNTVVMTPLQVREAFNANNSPPVYACRAWVRFDGSTVSSSLTGTYTRAVGTTLTICVATAHGFITGHASYIDFTTGGASDNTYIITVVDADTFTVNTVSTSSVLTSNLSVKRCPIAASGNIASVSRATTGSYYINFSVKMPSSNYAIQAMPGETVINRIMASQIRGADYLPTDAFYNIANCDGATVGVDYSVMTSMVFA